MTRVQGAAGAPPAAPCEPAPPPPVKPDLRAGLVVVLLLALATGIVRGDLGSALLTAYALALALALGLRRPLPSLTCAYLGVQLVRWICLRAAGVPLLPFLGVIATLVVRSWPVYVMVSALVVLLPMGQVMAALDGLGVRGTAMIVAIVVYRYVPTLLGEIRLIGSVARLRRTGPAWRVWLTRPLAQAERLVVPVLMRSARIADELSAVAVCKGMDPDRRRTALIEPRLGAADALVVAATAVVIGLAVRIGR